MAKAAPAGRGLRAVLTGGEIAFEDARDTVDCVDVRRGTVNGAPQAADTRGRKRARRNLYGFVSVRWNTIEDELLIPAAEGVTQRTMPSYANGNVADDVGRCKLGGALHRLDCEHDRAEPLQGVAEAELRLGVGDHTE